MHEKAIIDKILEPIQDPVNVVGVEVEVGELAGITAEHLQEHLRQRTGWNVHTTTKKSIVKCDCGYKGPAHIRQRLHDMVIYDCPKCKGNPKVLEGGNKIKILKIIYR